jgi:hypothetical protein
MRTATTCWPATRRPLADEIDGWRPTIPAAAWLYPTDR